MPQQANAADPRALYQAGAAHAQEPTQADTDHGLYQAAPVADDARGPTQADVDVPDAPQQAGAEDRRVPQQAGADTPGGPERVYAGTPHGSRFLSFFRRPVAYVDTFSLVGFCTFVHSDFGMTACVFVDPPEAHVGVEAWGFVGGCEDARIG